MAWKKIHLVIFQIIQLALCEPKCPESFPFLIEYAKSFYFTYRVPTNSFLGRNVILQRDIQICKKVHSNVLQKMEELCLLQNSMIGPQKFKLLELAKQLLLQVKKITGNKSSFQPNKLNFMKL